jgi:hypothetical protein
MILAFPVVLFLAECVLSKIAYYVYLKLAFYAVSQAACLTDSEAMWPSWCGSIGWLSPDR